MGLMYGLDCGFVSGTGDSFVRGFFSAAMSGVNAVVLDDDFWAIRRVVGSFSVFCAAAVRERFGGGEGARSGDAGRFVEFRVWDRTRVFLIPLCSAWGRGFTGAARVDRRGDILCGSEARRIGG